MDQSNNIEATLGGLFGGQHPTYTTDNGVAVEFLLVNLKRIATVTALLKTLAESDLSRRLGELITEIAKEQTELLHAGHSPNAINFNDARVLNKAFINRSLLLDVFTTCAGELPRFVEALSSISATDYDELALEEQLIIAAGVVAANYAFFTQTLPPIIARVMKEISARRGSSKEKTATK